MAGIGFKLRQKATEGSLKSQFFSFVQGAFITCGPWIMTIAAISGISLLHSFQGNAEEMTFFRSVIAYLYASSLIIFGIVQLPITRYLADELFLENVSVLRPTLKGSLVVTWAAYTCFLIPFAFIFNSWHWTTQLQVYTTGQVIIGLWVAMIFLTTLSHFKGILSGFFIGSTVSVIAAILLGDIWGIAGYIGGFGLGQALIFLSLCFLIYKEYDSKEDISFKFLGHFKKYPSLIAIGFAYNLGIWIDKILYWNSEYAVKIDQWIYVTPLYDSPLFFAYLTVIPSYTYFLIFTETQLFLDVRQYFATFMNHAPLDRIIKLKEKAFDTVQDNILKMVKYQGLITFSILLFSSYIIEYLHLQLAQLAVFRIGTLATLIHALVLILIILVLYFEFRKLAAFICILFCVLNASFTWITIQQGIQFMGIGYLCACILTLVIGLFSFAHALNQLEYLTLSKD